MADDDPPVAPAPNPAAVMYVPGLFGLEYGDGLGGVATRMARILDHQDRQVANAYEVRAAPSEPLRGSSTLVEVHEIVRTTPGADPVVTHRVFGLEYGAAIEAENTERNLITQTWAVTRVWAWMASLFAVRGAWASSMGRSQKLAAMVAVFGFFVLTVYFALLVVAVAGVLLAGETELPSILGGLQRGVKTLKDTFPRAAPLILLLGWLGLTFAVFREWIERMVAMFVRFNRYIDSGLGRAGAVGRFNDLLEHVCEGSNGPPSRIDVLAYSMGSVVALDALFPALGPPSSRASEITTLTTIGCPFDFIRTFWPCYFEGRALPEPSPRWINVYSPVDVFGSNFSDQKATQEASRGINDAAPRDGDAEAHNGPVLVPAQNVFYDHANRRELGYVPALLGSAFVAHSQYWVAGDLQAESCYGLFIPVVYT